MQKTLSDFRKEEILSYILEIMKTYGTKAADQEHINKEALPKNYIQEADTIFMITSRRAYFLYKLMDKEFNGKLSEACEEYGITLCGDQYILNCLDPEVFRGKTVILFDDVLSSGNTLFFYFCLLKKYGAADVVPCTYIRNTEYPPIDDAGIKQLEAERRKVFDRSGCAENKSEMEKEQIIKAYRKEFDKKLCWAAWEGPKQVGIYVVQGTVFFQKYTVPISADMPIYHSMETHAGQPSVLELSKAQWEKLSSGIENWRCRPVNFMIEGADLQQELTFGYFELQDAELQRRLNRMFFDFVVFYSYSKEQDSEKIKVTFSPVVIPKSLFLADLARNFFLLFGSGPYREDVIKQLREELNKFNAAEKAERMMKNTPSDDFYDRFQSDILYTIKHNHNICRAMYQSMIIDISLYIGKLFEKYIADTTGIQMLCDWDVMKDNLEDSMVSSIREHYDTMDLTEYRKKMLSFRIMSEVLPARDKTEYLMKNVPTQKRLELFLVRELLERKWSLFGDVDGTVISLESICHELKQRYDFQNAGRFCDMVTTLIIGMMGSGRVDSVLYADNIKETIHFGYKGN